LRSNKFGLSKSLLALKIVSYIVNLAWVHAKPL
jgi:hypothetical protein